MRLLKKEDVENAFRLVRMIYNRQFAEINQLYQNYEMNPEVGLLVGSVTKTPQIAKQAATRRAGGGLFNMCTAREELEQKLKQERMQKGIQKGESRFAKLLQLLREGNRADDIDRAIDNPAYREELYRQYHL